MNYPIIFRLLTNSPTDTVNNITKLFDRHQNQKSIEITPNAMAAAKAQTLPRIVRFNIIILLVIENVQSHTEWLVINADMRYKNVSHRNCFCRYILFSESCFFFCFVSTFIGANTIAHWITFVRVIETANNNEANTREKIKTQTRILKPKPQSEWTESINNRENDLTPAVADQKQRWTFAHPNENKCFKMKSESINIELFDGSVTRRKIHPKTKLTQWKHFENNCAMYCANLMPCTVRLRRKWKREKWNEINHKVVIKWNFERWTFETEEDLFYITKRASCVRFTFRCIVCGLGPTIGLDESIQCAFTWLICELFFFFSYNFCLDFIYSRDSRAHTMTGRKVAIGLCIEKKRKEFPKWSIAH